MKQVPRLALMAVAGWALMAQAEDGWKGEGELGFVSSSGNSETETVAGKMSLSYTAAPWEASLGLATLRSKDGEGVKTADHSQLTAQSNYSFDGGSYWLVALRYEEDQFSGFDYQLTASLGYGYKFWESESSRLAAEFGFGSRESKSSLSGDIRRETISRSKLTHFWKLTENLRWNNDVLVEAGEDNTFIEATTGLGVDVSTHFKLKFNYNVRRNSDVPLDAVKKDTVTTVNLVFLF